MKQATAGAVPGSTPGRAPRLALALLAALCVCAVLAAGAAAANPPAVTIATPTAITYHSAHLSGTVNPEGELGSAPTTWSFELSADGGSTWTPLPGGTIEPPASEEANPVAVEAEATELSAGHAYLIRLTATNATGPSTSAEEALETEAVAAPSASALTVSAVTATSAHFSATVDAGGTGPGEEAATYAFTCSPACPGLPGPAPIPADGSPHTVEATAANLEPNTPYVVTITATSPGGEVKAEEPFTTLTLAPDVATLPFVGPVSPEAARLYATVNPHNFPTTYFFEYGPTASYGTSIPASEDAEVPPGNTTQTVSQDLTGLSPTTTYHYRVVVHSPAGDVKGSDQALTTAAAPPPCSAAEQQLRSENNSTALPDCRAYERVTPAFKSGSTTAARSISPDGSRVVSESTGLFAGSQGGSLTANYESVRSGSGWSTEALDPPSSLYPAQGLLDVSANLGRSLWEARQPTESLTAKNLVRREPDGTFVEVGPMLPSSVTAGPPAGEAQQFFLNSEVTYDGASFDLSHAFFQVQEALFSGDTTQSRNSIRSLYEYVGTGNTEPQLVGISDAGTPATIAASHLISDCGTVLGSLRGSELNADVYNAISADGETVFFTAAEQGLNGCEESHAPLASELFARVGQGAGAHTVAISEPSAEDCQACQAAPVAAAEFQGASRDGSKAFFLTSQELLPGAKGENLYEYDFAGEAGEKIVPISTSTGVEEPQVLGVARVSEDGSHVYFVAQGVLTTEPNAEGNSPTAGGPNLYVFERDVANPGGRLAFVATLSEADSSAGCGSGLWCARDRRLIQTTPDGRFLVFRSSADLTPGDTSSTPQVFEYDAEREELIRVSVAEPGYTAGMEAADERGGNIPIQSYVQVFEASKSSSNLAVSDDGSVVEFASTGGLTTSTAAAGAAGRASVFEYRSAGPISNGRVVAVSNGSAQFSASARGTDATGTDAFFETVAPVLASDRDGQVDLYDARENGGFPAAALAQHCEGEGCQGPTSSTPSESPPATPGFQGPGNVTVKPCKQGFVPRHGKCVKRHTRKHHRKKHRRAAGTNRGGSK